MIKSHVAAGSLNYYLREFITKLELRELELWKQRGQERLGVWFEMLRLLLTDNKYWILLIDENLYAFKRIKLLSLAQVFKRI